MCISTYCFCTKSRQRAFLQSFVVQVQIKTNIDQCLCLRAKNFQICVKLKFFWTYAKHILGVGLARSQSGTFTPKAFRWDKFLLKFQNP